jgi:hypothetical protein
MRQQIASRRLHGKLGHQCIVFRHYVEQPGTRAGLVGFTFENHARLFGWKRSRVVDDVALIVEVNRLRVQVAGLLVDHQPVIMD